jgi:hypothetical protein
MSKYPSDDINLLLPTMQVKVRALLDAMTAAGFKPVLFDGLRTVEQALRNAKRGTGIVDSIHCYGAAADLICDVHGWDCRKHGCKFFTALGREAEALGFVWGGRFTKTDQPHVQGVTVAKQRAMRELGRGDESAAERDALVRAHFKL